MYALVWKTPMSRLGAELGISGNGLAKICDRLKVPYPPRGHWAKKEAGKPVVTYKLPARPDGIPERVDIHPTPPKPEPLPQVLASVTSTTAAISGIVVPETLDNLHPKVKAWLAQHEREQKEREQENKKRRRESWDWTRPLLDDLTERDLYRFRVTSAIFTAVEKAGGMIEDAPITGKVIFLVSGHKVECSIVEKMLKPLMRPEGDAAKWTAYAEHHQSGLQSSGFLRVTITTYLSGRQPQWIETAKNKIADWLPEIVGTVVAAGPILTERQREREETARRYREEAARRYERQRLKEIDERRWTRFREQATDWEERARLLLFVAELRRRLEVEGDIRVDDRQLSQWIAWAQEKVDALDPFGQGLAKLFESIDR
ncbi:hypothetical protein X743_32100 [Mesorhizobium sp. LNHC252B00]|nr:hypothetical protein X743_32100 [Mesorhizobium sp. LNHC252B00]